MCVFKEEERSVLISVTLMKGITGYKITVSTIGSTFCMQVKGLTMWQLLERKIFPFQLFNVTLEYFGNRTLCLSRSRFHLSSVCPCKENTAKGKEAFQGKFVVIVEGFAR